MEIKKNTVEKKIMHDGVCAARFSFTAPSIDGCDRFNDFYARLADSLAGWFAACFDERARREYDASEDPRKRWRYRPLQIRAVCCVGKEKNGKLKVIVTVCRTSGEKTEKKIVRAHIWNTKTWLVSPSWSKKPQKDASNKA